MLAVHKLPNFPAEAIETDGALATLQGLVCGHIEAAPVDGASVYVNEDGIGLELPLNVVLDGIPLHGPMVVLGDVDVRGADVSLTADEADAWVMKLNEASAR